MSAPSSNTTPEPADDENTAPDQGGTDATVTGMATGRARRKSSKARADRGTANRRTAAARASTDKNITGNDRVKMLAELGWERYSVGRSLERQIFVTPRVGPPVSRLLEGFSAELAATLALSLHKETGEIFSGGERREAMLNLSDKALDTKPVPTAVRIANPTPDSIAVDLANDGGEYVLITREGWKVTNTPGRVAFMRGPTSKALPYPVAGGDVNKLWRLMNIAERMRPLVVANLLTSLFKAIDHPILSLRGQAGSAKTTTAGINAYLLDPVEVGEGQGFKDVVMALPADIRDIYVTAGQRWFLPFDNIDRMTNEQQTALSIIATGGMRNGRTLYTDSGVTSIPVRGCVSFTAIDPGTLKPDFLDRLISIEVEPIPGGVFRTTGEIMAEFDSLHPEILGGLFDLAVEVLARLNDVRSDMQRRRVRVARLADYSYILATVDQVMGTNGFATFMQERDENQAEIANTDTFALTLQSLINDKDKGEGVTYTPTELLAELNSQFRADAADAFARVPKGWPENPSYMSRQINLKKIPLRNAGYLAELVKSNGVRKWHLSKAPAAPEPEPATPAPAPAPAPEPTPAPEPAPAEPVQLVAVHSLSALCRADEHARCADDLAAGTVDCWCMCHDGPEGGDGPPDLDVPPDPAEEPSVEDVAFLAEFGETEHDIDAVIDTAAADPEPAPAGPVGYSERRIMKWTVKPSAYVDLAAGRGITDAGVVFEIGKRGKLATLAELLRAVPAEVKFVHLTGADIGTDGVVNTWANTRLPKGWESLDQSLDGVTRDGRDRVSLRYRRPGVDGKPGTQLVIYRAAGWFGDRTEEAATSPEQLRDAFALLLDGLASTFGEVCGEQYGVPLKGTPGSTGLELIRRTLPRDRAGEPHRYPILDTELQHLIRTHAGQGRTENYAALDHPTGGANIADRIPGLHVVDMRFAYAKFLDMEMPTGPVVRDTVPEFARRGSGWEPCLYRVRVTVPAGWDRVGPFRTRDDSGKWIYPHTPGETFEAYMWERGLYAADRDGWRIGEHVEILERFRFTGPKTKPLAAFGRALRALRDEWIPAQDQAGERVQELARIMARQIAIAAVGKLTGAEYGKLRSCPIDDLTSRPDDGTTSVWPSVDGKRWEWLEKVGPGRDWLVHPEWSAYIWGICRDWLYSHPTQRGVGIRHVPLNELVAARTDGYWTTTPQDVTDTGKVGAFRVQLAHNEPLDAPRTMTALNEVRAALLAEEGDQ
ncbi:hypothetical protein [Nocardia sp. NPDC003963]